MSPTWIVRRPSRIVSIKASSVRAAVDRKAALSYENSLSIGFRSGLQAGR